MMALLGSIFSPFSSFDPDKTIGAFKNAVLTSMTLPSKPNCDATVNAARSATADAPPAKRSCPSSLSEKFPQATNRVFFLPPLLV